MADISPWLTWHCEPWPTSNRPSAARAPAPAAGRRPGADGEGGELRSRARAHSVDDPADGRFEPRGGQLAEGQVLGAHGGGQIGGQAQAGPVVLGVDDHGVEATTADLSAAARAAATGSAPRRRGWPGRR